MAGDVHPAAPRLAAAGEGDVVAAAHGRGRGLQLLGLGARAGEAGPGGGGGAVLGGGLVPAPGPWTDDNNNCVTRLCDNCLIINV